MSPFYCVPGPSAAPLSFIQPAAWALPRPTCAKPGMPAADTSPPPPLPLLAAGPSRGVGVTSLPGSLGVCWDRAAAGGGFAWRLPGIPEPRSRAGR